MLTNAWLDEKRRPWRRERSTDWLPETGVWDAQPLESAQLGQLLAALGPRQRAVVVLRFYCDQSVEETARVLQISEGTVKSQTARALEALRVLAVANGVAR
jgi:DNA-directed RNA polymerase specialized sigma24 family protein